MGSAVVCGDEVPLMTFKSVSGMPIILPQRAHGCSCKIIFTSVANLMQGLSLNIDQRVFFVDLETGSVHESYEVNNVTVQRQIARVALGESYKVNVNPGMGNFLQRRSDFMGRTFKVVLDQQVSIFLTQSTTTMKLSVLCCTSI